MKSFLLSIPVALCSLSSAQAFTLPEFGRPIPVAPEFAADAASYDFEGIVALSNCSGSLVRFDDSQDTDKALVLSNGHCTGNINPGKVVLNQANTRTFDVLSPTAAKLGTVHAEKIVYATMTKTDVSLYQTKETYAEIRSKYKVDALTLSREAPGVGTDIEVLSGYWKRGYACSIAAIVDSLKEGSWTFEKSLRYTASCDTVGGTSGSPVVAAGTRMVVAVNNTGNESGAKCTVNNPCEVNKDGSIVYKKGYNYAQQTYWLYSCRNDEGQIDVKTTGCQLPK